MPLSAAVAALAMTAGTALPDAGRRSGEPAPGADQQILGTSGTASNGDLTYSIDRTDINNVTLNGTPIKPSFQVNGAIDFQPLDHGGSRGHGGAAAAATPAAARSRVRRRSR